MSTKARRRKRTNSNVPAKGRLRDMADRLWALAVRDDWANRCAVCGYGKCEAHHLVPRTHEATRYDMRNGIALCSRHHKFDKDISPHQNAAGWLQWLSKHHPGVYAWYAANANPKFDGTKNVEYYCDVIRRLSEYVPPEHYRSIVGVRFAQWLDQSRDIPSSVG